MWLYDSSFKARLYKIIIWKFPLETPHVIKKYLEAKFFVVVILNINEICILDLVKRYLYFSGNLTCFSLKGIKSVVYILRK